MDNGEKSGLYAVVGALVQGERRSDLAAEPGAERLVVGQFRMNDLDGDGAARRRGAQVDPAHPARPEPGPQPVGPYGRWILGGEGFHVGSHQERNAKRRPAPSKSARDRSRRTLVCTGCGRPLPPPGLAGLAPATGRYRCGLPSPLGAADHGDGLGADGPGGGAPELIMSAKPMPRSWLMMAIAAAPDERLMLPPSEPLCGRAR
jgi:hypothetical protein